jgi:hypothetical protein
MDRHKIYVCTRVYGTFIYKLHQRQITDADEACRSSEISVNLIITIVFLETYSYFCYILTSFFGVVLHFKRLFIILFACIESLTTCFRSDIP